MSKRPSIAGVDNEAKPYHTLVYRIKEAIGSVAAVKATEYIIESDINNVEKEIDKTMEEIHELQKKKQQLKEELKSHRDDLVNQKRITDILLGISKGHKVRIKDDDDDVIDLCEDSREFSRRTSC